MGRWRRNLAIGACALVAGAALFAIPTVWGRPWSIEHFYLRVFARFALERPMLLSRLRILEPFGLDFHADELDDFSPEFALASARRSEEELRILRSYDWDTLSESQRLSAEVLEWFLATRVEGEPFLFHDYPVNQMDGVQSALPDFMLNVHQVGSEAEAESYVARLGAFEVALDQAIDGLRFREERGVVPPRFVLDRVVAEIDSFLEPPPERHVLASRFGERLATLSLSEGRRAELLAAAAAEVSQSVYPVYRRLRAELVRLRSGAGTDDGVWRLPDGDAYYAWRLRSYTTTNRSADEIHALGLSEVERIHGEMREILRSEGLPTSDLAATLRTLNREERFLYPDDDDGRARILADYGAIIEDANARLPALFGVLPRAPVTVERVPEFKEAGAPGAYYNPPPFDGSKPGIFYANLRSVREIPKFGMRTLTYHESVPGHHLQIAIAQELEGVPFFRRVLPFTAFVEGWALYAEQLASEEGFHPTPYDGLGRLIAEVFRAARLVVDTGIHTKRWTREQAIAYMLENTGMPETDVVAEVERYIVLPGQACAYKVGQLEILRLREEARASRGAAFDLAGFHDNVLGSGALPLTLLDGIVAEWASADGSPEGE